MDTNVNYQRFNGDLSPYLGKSFSYGDLAGLNSQMGASAGNQPTFINGNNIYQVKDNGNNTFSLQQIDTVANRQALAAQQQYQAGIGSAVTGLQGQQSNLKDSYGSLLADVMGQGTVAMNTATSGENAFLGARGLLSQAGLGNNQLSQAQLAVQAQNQAAAGSIGLGSAQDINALQEAIASLQAGGAGTAVQIPLEFGSLALSQQTAPAAAFANLGAGAASYASARYIPIPNLGIYDLQNNRLLPNTSSTGLSGGGLSIAGNF